MKNFKNKNLFFIIVLILSICFALSTVKVANNVKSNQEILSNNYKKTIEDCNKVVEGKPKYETCQIILKDDNPYEKLDIYDLGFEIINNYIFYGYNVFFFLFIIIAGSCLYVTKYLRSEIIKNTNHRKSYRKIKKELFISSWKYAIIVPVMLLICYIIMYIYTNTYIISDINMETNNLNEYNFGNNMLLYNLKDLYNALVLGLIYTNVTLLIARKEHNYVLAVIKSFLAIIGIELFLEIVLNGLVLPVVFKFYDGDFLNIIDLTALQLSSGFYPKIIFITVLMIISFVLVFISYKDKESLIIDCEKNDDGEEA